MSKFDAMDGISNWIRNNSENDFCFLYVDDAANIYLVEKDEKFNSSTTVLCGKLFGSASMIMAYEYVTRTMLEHGIHKRN